MLWYGCHKVLGKEKEEQEQYGTPTSLLPDQIQCIYKKVIKIRNVTSNTGLQFQCTAMELLNKRILEGCIDNSYYIN